MLICIDCNNLPVTFTVGTDLATFKITMQMRGSSYRLCLWERGLILCAHSRHDGCTSRSFPSDWKLTHLLSYTMFHASFVCSTLHQLRLLALPRPRFDENSVCRKVTNSELRIVPQFSKFVGEMDRPSWALVHFQPCANSIIFCYSFE